MEIVKYICEFFFTNFWHWLGLVIVLGVITSGRIIRTVIRHIDKEKDNE